MGGSAAAGAKSNQARAPTHTSAAGRGTVLPSVAAGGRTSKQNRARNEAHLAVRRDRGVGGARGGGNVFVVSCASAQNMSGKARTC